MGNRSTKKTDILWYRIANSPHYAICQNAFYLPYYLLCRVQHWTLLEHNPCSNWKQPNTGSEFFSDNSFLKAYRNPVNSSSVLQTALITTFNLKQRNLFYRLECANKQKFPTSYRIHNIVKNPKPIGRNSIGHGLKYLLRSLSTILQ